MIAILIKELRENLKWAALTALLISGLLAWATGEDLRTGMSLLGSRIEVLCPVVFPVAGFALGLLAILPDARRGRRQFVMHRPIARSRIFVVKVAGGAALYLLATLLPLLTVYAWSATPGHVAGPVTPDMLLPRLADLFGGLAWFGAGMLVAARQARWVGSRLVPLGGAFLVSLLATQTVMTFTEALLIDIAGAALFLLPAHSAFVAGGDVPRRAWVVRALLGMPLAVGWAIVVAAALAASSSIVETFLGLSSPDPYKHYELLDDGRIAIINDSDPGNATDLQGRLLGMNPTQLEQDRMSLTTLQLQRLRPQDLSYASRVRYWGFYRPAAHLRSMNTMQTGTTAWYFIVSQNAFEGFDSYTRRAAGSLGPDGWSRTLQPFPKQVYLTGWLTYYNGSVNRSMVASENRVWGIEFNRHVVRDLFIAPPGETVLDAVTFNRTQPFVETTNAIVTDQGLYVFKDGQPPLRVPLMLREPAYIALSVGRTKDGRLVLDYQPNFGRFPRAKESVMFVGEGGNVLQQVELPALSTVHKQPTWDLVLQAAAMPPGFLVAIVVTKPHEFLSLVFGVVLSLAVLASLGTIPLARRRQYSTAGVAGWALLNLLLGIPGVLLLLSMDDAVPTERCPACGRQRPVNRRECPHCAAEFAAPKRLEIEVFANA